MSQKIFVKSLIVILVLGLSATAQAEYPVVEWTRQLGTSTDDYGNGVAVDGSGNIYVTGNTWGGLDGNTNAGKSDIFLTKYDMDGAKLWTQQLGTADSDGGFGVSIDGNGNAYITGRTRAGLDGNTHAGIEDIFLSKFDTEGTKLWTRQLGTAKKDSGSSVSVDCSGNVFITGSTQGGLDGNTNAGGSDTFLTKYDTNGTKLWTQQLRAGFDDGGSSVSVDTEGNVYVTGYFEWFEDDIFLLKYNTHGAMLWSQQLSTAYYDRGQGVSVDAVGNVYVTGYSGGDLVGNTNVNQLDMFLTKYNTYGTKLWTQQLGEGLLSEGYGVSVDAEGNAYATGVIGNIPDANNNMGYLDIFLTKYDTAGTKLWTQQLGTLQQDFSRGVSVDAAGNAYVTGWTTGSLDGNPNVGRSDIFLTKISSIPEPSSISMLISGVLILVCRRRQKSYPLHFLLF